MDDPWAAVFQAAGAVPGDSLHERNNDHAPKPKKKKKRRRTNQQSYLQGRLSAFPDALPPMDWKESLLTANCPEFQGKENMCQTCRERKCHHRMRIAEGTVLLRLLVSIRNWRMEASLHLQKTSYTSKERKHVEKLRRSLSPNAIRLIQATDALLDSSRSSASCSLLQVMMKCDAVYNELYYYNLTQGGCQESIPHPVTYFGSWLALHQPECIPDDNALATLHAYRRIETQRLAPYLQGSPWEDASGHETPGPSLLCQWRDSCRDFLCHLYAYATVSNDTLTKLVEELQRLKIQRIYEVGAGTGYWALLLRNKGLVVQATDIAPTSTKSNEYHGCVPPFGTVSTSAQLPESSDVLLLCYPPPNDMAFSVLKDYSGEILVHVGEWQGLTGNTALEEHLLTHYRILCRLPCERWGTDCAEITLWKRGSSEDTVLLPCQVCGRESSHRCRAMRNVTFCGESCYRKFDWTTSLQEAALSASYRSSWKQGFHLIRNKKGQLSACGGNQRTC